MNKKVLFPLSVFLFFSLFFILVFKAYYQQFGAFGCFDDCFNFVAGRFMLNGRSLYSGIFFNHQPLAAYISYVIQGISSPQNAYQLVFDHRVFMLFFSFALDILLILRFGLPAAGFVVFYEITKFYFFGDRFLGEALIVQPLVYTLGIAWEKLQKNKLFFFDFLLAGAFSWFAVFMREPYIPVALFIFAFILWGKKFSKLKIISLFIFLSLSIITLGFINLSEYFFQVFKLNIGVIFPKDGDGNVVKSLLTSFLYPLEIIFSGKMTFLRQILIGIDFVFLASIAFSFKLKKYKEIIFIFLALGFSAIRPVAPGTEFYEAFHMLPWYGLFLASSFFLLKSSLIFSKKISYLLMLILFGTFIYSLYPSEAFVWKKIDRLGLFKTNYAPYFSYGETIKILASPKDKLFVDLWDDFMYWQAGLDSSYKYSLYTPLMKDYKKYNDARVRMFSLSPPDFYYSHCDKGKPMFSEAVLPKNKEKDYKQLYTNKMPSCLFVKNARISQISKKQLEEIEKLGFYLHE